MSIGRRSARYAALVSCSMAGCAPGAEPRLARPAGLEARAAYSPAELAQVVDIDALAIAPDASELAIVTDRSGAYELWTAPLDREGGAGPLVQRTRAGETVAGLAYAPDGASLVFQMDHGGDERCDLWLARRGAAPERLTDTPLSEEQARFSPDGRSLVYVVDRDTPFRFNVEVLDLATRKARALTRETINVQTPRWSPDGRTIAALRSPDFQQGEMLLVDVASGAVRVIAAPTARGILQPVDFLPDGRPVALATNDRGFLQVAVVDLPLGGVRFVGPPDWDVEEVHALADGSLVLSRNVHGASEVCLLEGARLADGACRVISADGVVAALALDRDGRTLAALRSTSSLPAEVVALGLGGRPEKTLVPPILGRVDPANLTVAERREIPSFDGKSIDVYSWAPPVARLGAPAPAVVIAHGGPESQVRPELVPEAQALAEAGFMVIAPNFRGSSGYGQAFLDLDNKDWGGGDLQDIHAAVDALAARGEIDPARLAIMGESFGGYLVLRAITASPERWAAAVDLYGMPDLIADYEMTKDRFGPWYETEMGTPERDPALFRERSPIFALERVRAPLLVLQGENDTNVPRAESDAMVSALEARKHPVEYVVYPDEGHGFTKRETRVDAISRAVAFLVRHLGAPRRREPRP